MGTQIDSFARSVGDDRYKVTVIIEESSVYGEDATSVETFKAPGVPVFRSFESSNTLVLRDGQSRQYMAAADRVTGESIRVDVALTVLDWQNAPAFDAGAVLITGPRRTPSRVEGSPWGGPPSGRSGYLRAE